VGVFLSHCRERKKTKEQKIKEGRENEKQRIGRKEK
jgi:hypothetical protein